MKRLAVYLTIGVFLAVYVLVVISIGAAILPDHWAVQLLFYGVLGIVWIFPVMWLLTFFHERGSRG